jgi:hypothetical protein
MPKKVSTVWMVHALTGLQGLKGQLVLEEHGVVFRPADARHGEELYRFEHIKKVKRAWGTPVLELRLQIPDGIPVVGFYFTPPPSLEPPPEARFSFKRRARRRAAAELYRANSSKREEIDRWHQLIQQALRR